MPSPRSGTIGNRHIEEAGHAWAAVRVPRSIGLDALAMLGGQSGAVLEDPLSASLYWFIPQGASSEWDVPNTTAGEQEAYLAFPPVRRTEGPGLHWRICPGEGAWVTEPAALRAALLDAFGPAFTAEASV
ncbi:hypothetical protein ACIBO4_30530 [Streptomyces sp. NPDC050149]|uniref:hypothetical protein n=1 Tax=Streptomyces sp. NPDC050149 TaxID=3365603 RepID=UPI0037ADD5C6